MLSCGTVSFRPHKPEAGEHSSPLHCRWYTSRKGTRKGAFSKGLLNASMKISLRKNEVRFTTDEVLLRKMKLASQIDVSLRD